MASGSKCIQYSESTRRIASCDNMEDFWRSELLSNRMALNVADRFRTIDARMVFREGTPPQWEDEANAQGGHLQVQFKPSLGGGQLDEYWNNLVLGVIGGSIEPADVITGVRFVNVYVGCGSNLQTRSGMTWKGVSLAGTQWSRRQLSPRMLFEHCRMEKFSTRSPGKVCSASRGTVLDSVRHKRTSANETRRRQIESISVRARREKHLRGNERLIQRERQRCT